MESAVVTFDRHPAAVVRPESAPRLLTDLDQKLELLAATGIDRCLVITFDEARSKEPAEEFVQEVLVDCLGAKVVIVGEDFHFGHQRKGNVALLEEMGADLGFEVEGLALVDADGRRGRRRSPRPARPPSATRWSRATSTPPTRCSAGPTRCAASSPTATSAAASWGSPPPTCRCPATSSCPPTGSTPAGTSGPTASVHPTAISLGRRPTFYEEAHASLLEAHLLDFDGDLYDEPARVRFVARLRGEVKFDSVDALVEQIHRDCDEARAILRLAGGGRLGPAATVWPQAKADQEGMPAAMTRAASVVGVLLLAAATLGVPEACAEPGSMRWPVSGYTASFVGYREHPVTHEWKLHDGHDIGRRLALRCSLPWAAGFGASPPDRRAAVGWS